MVITMKYNIEKCSLQFLKSAFTPLDKFEEYVFWIRTLDMSRQIYVSPSYLKIWAQDVTILFEIPLIWLDYLSLDNKSAYMKVLQARHEKNYLDSQKNLVMFQITKPSGTSYIIDKCFRCQSRMGKQYIVGISKSITTDIWHLQLHNPLPNWDENDWAIAKEFLLILKQVFEITQAHVQQTKSSNSTEFGKYIEELSSFSFSRREYECLRHFCLGKTYKQTAREMDISPRTVETYLENIRNKTACANKIQVVSRFSRYFTETSLLTNLSD